MWPLIKLIGFAGFLGGFAVAAMGYKEIAIILVPLSFPIAAFGICGPVIFKPKEEFEEKGSIIGTKLSAIAFMFIAIGFSVSALLKLEEKTAETFFYIGFPFFFLGIFLNIYKAWKAGEL